MGLLQKIRFWLPPTSLCVDATPIAGAPPRGEVVDEGGSSPLGAVAEWRRRQFAALQYDEQQKHLQELLGDAIFVAEYMVLERIDGSAVSVAAWSDGGPSLLPKVDEIAFVVNSDPARPEVFRVPWDSVIGCVGTLLSRMSEHFPERYLARGWPADAALIELRRRAV